MKNLLLMIVLTVISIGFVSSVSAANFGYQAVKNQSIMQQEVLDALVEPYLEQIEIRSEKNDGQKYLNVWVVADDGQGYKVFYNQETRKFGLAKYVDGDMPFTSDTLHVQNELTKLFLARR